MGTTASAVSASSPSPIDKGKLRGLDPIVPDSYIRTRFGAWVVRAKLAAGIGKPIHTEQTSPSARAREAATVMTSSALARVPSVGTSRSLGLRADIVPVLPRPPGRR